MDSKLKKIDPLNPETISTRVNRKQVTILFCDIANYTKRALEIEPTILADEIHQFRTTCTGIAESNHGYVSDYSGNGLMVLFGHPEASEFSAEQAVRGSLKMVEAIRQKNIKNDDNESNPVEIRIGIATGLVVVGANTDRENGLEELVFGNAPGLAARLQDIAKPNTILIAHRTRRLLGLNFRLKDLGKISLENMADPVNAWQVLSERNLPKRQSIASTRTNSNFVSRQLELTTLNRNFANACFGFSRFVHIIGEAGIGKSRLMRVFEKSISHHDLYRMRINCSPYYQNSFLKPARDECFRWLQINEDDDLLTKQASVNWALSILNLDPTDRDILFSEFLDIPSTTPSADLKMGTQEKRNRTIQILAQVIIKICDTKPLLLIAEDVHWADSGTLDMLSVITKQAVQDQLLVTFTSRPQFISPWQNTEALSTIKLEGLNEQDSEKLVEYIFKNHPLPAKLKQRLIHKSDGIPLFLEESSLNALRLITSSDEAGQLDNYDVPETLQDSLNARLDQLGEAKATAQLASIFGPSFNYDKICALADINEIDAVSGIATLTSENILILDHKASHQRYKFRHVMLQETAYQSLLIKTRQHYHQQIADLYQSTTPGFSEKNPELLAYHLAKTDQISQAISLWIKAGTIAYDNALIDQAIEYAHQGLDLISSLPNDLAQRNKYELSLRVLLATSHSGRDGYNSNDALENYQLVTELYDSHIEPTKIWRALYGLWQCYASRGQYTDVLRTSIYLRRLYRQHDHPMLKMTLFQIKALAHMVDGKLDKANYHFDQARNIHQEFYSRDQKITPIHWERYDLSMLALGATTKLMVGEISKSISDITSTIEIARRRNHPYTLVATLNIAAYYAKVSRNIDLMRSYCNEAIDICNQYGFQGLLAVPQIFLAFDKLIKNNDATRIEDLKTHLVVYERTQGSIFLVYFKSILAEAYLFCDLPQLSYFTANSLIYDISDLGEHWEYPAILHTKAKAALKGNLAPHTEIQEWYLTALETAANQQSRLLLSRILIDHSIFDIDPKRVKHYEKIILEADENIAFINHEYITHRH